VAEPKNTFLTGRPGIGKTTVILKTVELLRVPVGGFTTREIRRDGRRVGFRIEDLEGNGAVMAHVETPSSLRVSRYGVDVKAIERVGVRAVRRAVAAGLPVILDEAGRMELAAPAFLEALLAAFDAPVPVLGTMHRRRDSVTRAIRSRDDTRVIEVTQANRDDLPERLARALAEAAGPSAG
jgi:nucleoside-triphosphatase